MELKRKTLVSLPELVMIGGTRALLGAGIALLFAGRLKPDQQKSVGWTLFAVGALSTIPLAFELFGERRVSTVGQAWSDDQMELAGYGADA